MGDRQIVTYLVESGVPAETVECVVTHPAALERDAVEMSAWVAYHGARLAWLNANTREARKRRDVVFSTVREELRAPDPKVSEAKLDRLAPLDDRVAGAQPDL